MRFGWTWLQFPFTVGNPTSSHDPSSDGLISAVQVFLLTFGVGCAFCLAHWLTLQNHALSVEQSVVQVLLMVYMAMAIIIMIFFLRYRNSSDVFYRMKVGSAYSTNEQTPLGRWRTLCRWIKNIVKHTQSIFAMLVFYGLSVILHVPIVLTYAACLATYSECGLLGTYVTALSCDISRLVFMSVMLAFCVTFQKYSMVRRPLVQYGLVMIGAASLTNWFNCAVTFPLSESALNSNCTHRCLTSSYIGHNVTHTLVTFLYPLHVQFFVMATKVILQLFIATITTEILGTLLVRTSQPSHHRYRSLPNTVDVTGDSMGWRPESGVSPDSGSDVDADSGETSSPSCPDVWEQLPVTMSATTEIDYHPTGRTSTLKQYLQHFVASKYVCTVHSVILHVIFLSMLLYYHSAGRHIYWYCDVYAAVITMYRITVVCVCLIGFYVTRIFRIQSKSYDGLEIAVLLTSIGYIISLVCDAIASVRYQNYAQDIFENVPFSLTGTALFICAIHLQTGLMFRVSRVDTGQVVLPSSLQTGQLMKAILRNVLIFLCLYNFVMWVTTSIFFSILYGQQQTIYEKATWHIVSHILHPLYLFYNFNIAMAFLGMYLKIT